MKTNVTTSENQIKEQKNALIEKRKEEIKNPKLSNKNLLELDLNNLDLSNIKGLIKENVKTKEISTKFQMYKFERTDLSTKEQKKKRTQIRNKRNKLTDNILYFFSNDKKEELKKEINLFNQFYKETYILNDLSLISICQSNADEDTKIKLNFMLKIVKEFK